METIHVFVTKANDFIEMLPNTLSRTCSARAGIELQIILVVRIPGYRIAKPDKRHTPAAAHGIVLKRFALRAPAGREKNDGPLWHAK
jgi:hypothetical protein